MKKIKHIALILMTAVLMFSLTGCGESKKAEAAVNGMFEAFKNLNFEAAQEYVNVNDIGADETGTNENLKVVMDAVFKNLNCEILSSEKIDKNNVAVKANVTATDMKPVMQEYMVKAISYAFENAFADPQPSEEETNQKLEEILVECASKPDLETVTNEVDIKVVKADDGKWNVEVDDAFEDALLGGLEQSVKDIENTLNAED